MMFKRKKSKLEHYHPSIIESEEHWYIAHATIGAKQFLRKDMPFYFDRSLTPEWYQKANDENILERVEQLQEKYESSIIQWVSQKGVSDVFIAGVDEKREQELLRPFSTTEGHIKWKDGLAEVLPIMNIFNFYIEAEDGTRAIIYESDTSTVFIYAPNNDVPSSLRAPWITEENLVNR